MWIQKEISFQIVYDTNIPAALVSLQFKTLQIEAKPPCQSLRASNVLRHTLYIIIHIIIYYIIYTFI